MNLHLPDPLFPGGLSRWGRVLSVSLLLVFWVQPAHAWGPGTHLYLANKLLELAVLSSSIQALLEAKRAFYQYGNVIADVVVGKDLIDFEEHSHNWKIARRLRERAETDEERAFATGFWTHLAADTVAHNVYVPKQILTTSSTRKFGHAYWELRADEKIPNRTWNDLKQLLKRDFTRENDLLEEIIPRTVLPFSLNHLIQKSLVNLHSLESWQKMVLFVRRFSRYQLSRETINSYHSMCLQRMRHSLQPGEKQDTILEMDPTGGDLAHSMKITREELQKMIAEGEADKSVYDEAVRQLFPEVHET